MQEKSRQHFGQFEVANQNLFGELTLDGRSTNLRLHSHDYINLLKVTDRCITGELPDSTKVTLLHCNIPPVPGRRSSRNDVSFFADIFPHHVVLGREHLNPDRPAIWTINWHLPDLSSVFYDFDAFGSSSQPEDFIDGILREREELTGRKVRRGEYPEVLYFSGQSEIFACPLGRSTLSVYHSYEQSMGGPGGVWLKSQTQLSLRFEGAVTFDHAIEQVHRISVFLGAVIGRPQNVENISVSPSQGDEHFGLQVLPSLPVRYEIETSRITPGPRDVLLDGLERPDEFATVLKHWFETHDEMAASRNRFWDSFRKQNYFDADRIIAAANLFDTIPQGLYPKKVDLSNDIQDAIKKATALFRPLPQTQERDSLLQALGRASHPSLKSKVKFWAHEIIEKHHREFPNLEFVIDRAVNCRNFFVHGGKPEIDYSGDQAIHTLSFLTRALELCYILPEFLRAGWQWTNTGYHPFGEFQLGYHHDLDRLKKAVESSKA
ncbi:HEPN domain-containing protein [Devosia sp.]|uniref:ApeA N-terminal domain 1-containing protein n=1 Tax=Devosia sp. TaxID=1871048 RepID=UPI002FCA3350